MTRIVLGAIALAALAVAAFVMEVRRIAAGLDVTPEADDSEIVGMPTTWVPDWHGGYVIRRGLLGPYLEIGEAGPEMVVPSSIRGRYN